MKRLLAISSLMVVVMILITNCKKEDTLATIPTLSTSPVSEITDTTIICGGNVSNDGGAPITVLGVCWGENENPTTASNKTQDGSGSTSYTSVIKGFLPGRVYHIRAYATNAAGTAYGQDIMATTNVILPKIKASGVTSITLSTAVGGGTITSNGGAAIITKGVCWNTTGNPTVDDNKTSENNSAISFTCSLTGLEVFKFYYLRAYATNSAGTAYSEQITFRTRSLLTVTDVEGNVYNTVAIGTQVWMAENLKTTRYRNGTLIPEVKNDEAWFALREGAYCSYDNESGNAKIYGNLYNSYAVVDTNKICPSGWHVPARWEWEVLENYLGGNYIAGGKMKEEGLSHWASPNTGATNSSGFSALPGGTRGDDNDGRFCFKLILADFWTSERGWFFRIVYSDDDSRSNIGTSAISGKSVRCLKD